MSGIRSPYGFHGPGDYELWLSEAGLLPIRAELIPKDMVHTREKFDSWIRTTWLPYTNRVPAALREEFIEDLVNAYLSANPYCPDGLVHVAMIRLEVEAQKR